MPAAQFITSAERRSANALQEMANELMHLHSQARDARIHSKPIQTHVNIEIIQKRHHAINWVIGYEGLPWDEVTTDTYQALSADGISVFIILPLAEVCPGR
jgi:hypothetical protein